MFGVTTSDDYRPVAWMGRYPVDVTTMLVGLHVVFAVMGCFLFMFGASGFLSWLQFDSASVLHSWTFHQIFTYAFVHSPSTLLWFAVEMYMLFVFGREVERFLGQRAYIALYMILLLAPPLILTISGFWQRAGLSGSPALHFGVFVAFAAIYPRVELFLRIMAKWVAVILGAIYTMQLLAFHAWSDLVVVWTSIGAAFLFVELRGAGPELLWWDKLMAAFQPKPKLHIVQRPGPRQIKDPDDVYESVDPILDKISKSGIGSLTANERRQLDRARARLLQKSD